jgi:hypothetical protein
MDSLEAVPVVERYIDSAVLARLHTVTNHPRQGHRRPAGRGAASLRRMKQVKSFARQIRRRGNGRHRCGTEIKDLKRTVYSWHCAKTHKTH